MPVDTLKSIKEKAAKLKPVTPVTPPNGYVLSAYTPSVGHQIRDAVANSAIGHSIEQTMPKVADFLSLHPTEVIGTPEYERHKDQLIAPERATSAIADGLGLDSSGANKERLEGALRGVGSLTSGQNLAMMGGTAVAAGLTAGVVNPASAQVLSRLVSGGFTLDMLHGLYQQHKDYRKAVDAGDTTEAHKIQGEMGVTGIMALLAGHHALSAHPDAAIHPFHEEEPNDVHHSAQNDAPAVDNPQNKVDGAVAPVAPPVSGEVAPSKPVKGRPVNQKAKADADEFKAALSVPAKNEEGLAIPSIDVDVKFPPPKEMETAWRDASMNQQLREQFKRTGIEGFSIKEPYKFGLSEQGNIDPKTGKIAINAAVSNPTHTLAHEVAHDIYNRLTPENRAEIDRYVSGADHIYPEHGGGLEERVMDHFADEISHPMSASAPSHFRKIFFESPLEPRPASEEKTPETTAIEPKRPIYGTWSDVAMGGGYIRMGDDVRGLVEKDGDFPLVLKDTYGARHVMPASIAADVLESPAHNYVREVFMAKDHVHDDATSKLEKDLSDKKKMLAANSFMSHEMVDGKLINEPDPKKPLHDKYRKELEADIPKIEGILESRKAGVPHKPVPTFANDVVQTQTTGARMLTDAINTFANRNKLTDSYKTPELPAEAGSTEPKEITEEQAKNLRYQAYADQFDGKPPIAKEDYLKGLGVDGPHVLTDVPLDDLKNFSAKGTASKAVEYSKRDTPFPPVHVENSGANPGKLYVRDGNHRVDAARMRGDKTIQAMMPAEHLGKYLEGKNIAAPQDVKPDRRMDPEERKRVEHMTPEEMRKALLTSDKTGIPNRRAFDDAEHDSPSPAVGMSDADGLKALNDKFGYAAGDELLKAKAEALKAAGLDAYHEKGDEFLYRGASPQDLKEKLEKARTLLRDRVIEVTLKDGTKLHFKGADFSYGTGKDTDESEEGLKAHKQEREQAGERARGELRGITQVKPE